MIDHGKHIGIPNGRGGFICSITMVIVYAIANNYKISLMKAVQAATCFLFIQSSKT